MFIMLNKDHINLQMIIRHALKQKKSCRSKLHLYSFYKPFLLSMNKIFVVYIVLVFVVSALRRRPFTKKGFHKFPGFHGRLLFVF